ncbi:MAG: hypothetical protein LRZ88_01725 [Candidatus Cloacimonetes bacterium]|nr:hypothetical protein [Candidatus Cloacimonadota bacterium]
MKKYILLSLLLVLVLSVLQANAIATLMAHKGKVSLNRVTDQIKFKKG